MYIKVPFYCFRCVNFSICYVHHFVDQGDTSSSRSSLLPIVTPVRSNSSKGLCNPIVLNATNTTVLSPCYPSQYMGYLNVRDTRIAADFLNEQRLRIHVCGDVVDEIVMQSLQPREWVNGQIIDAFLHIMHVDYKSTMEYQRLTIFRQMFSLKFSDRNYDDDKIWLECKHTTYHWDPSYLDNDIAMPFNIGNTHWITILIRPQFHTIYVIDGFATTEQIEIARRVLRWYKCEYEDRKKEVMGFEFTILFGREQNDTRPIQTDGFSCGVLTSFTILCFMLYRTLPNRVTHFRQEIVDQLRFYMVFTIRKAIENDYSVEINPRPVNVIDVNVQDVD